ncbi:MAG: hypothetical protein ABSC08_07520 [Bryobacteraceae bacterium]|jgi:hypothetical protein
MDAKEKNPAAVALGRKGGKRGGPARAAKLTPEQRSASARNAVQVRWARKAKEGNDSMAVQSGNTGSKNAGELRRETSETIPATAVLDTSKKALHLCLKQIKEAKSESELQRLTGELQRIVFHRQYRNA